MQEMGVLAEPHLSAPAQPAASPFPPAPLLFEGVGRFGEQGRTKLQAARSCRGKVTRARSNHIYIP